jgi:hypothetical protein
MNYRRAGGVPLKPLVTSEATEPTSMKKQVLANDKKLKGEESC